MTNFKAKMHQIPAGEAYSAPPDPKLDLGAASRQGGGAGLRKRRERRGRGKWRAVKGRAPSYC